MNGSKAEYYKLHQDCMTSLAPLFTRMDDDKNLYQLEPYIMKSLDNQKMKDVHNVTLNDPAVFGHRTISLLSATHQQIIVKGKGMSDAETSYIEDFLNAVLWEADQRLINRGYGKLFDWNSFHSGLRGRIASRNLVRVENKKLLIDILPWDTRYVSYLFSPDGLKQLGYETKRSAYDIEDEYKVKGIGGAYGQVVDIYTDKEHIVTIYGKQHKKETHKYGEVPCIYQIVPAGSRFQDSDSIQHQGESIYALNRDIYKQLNKVASVLMTQNMQSFEAGLQYESEAGEGANLPDEDPRAPGAMTAVEPGRGFKPIPTNDMKMATRHLLALLERRAQWGSISSIDYGNLTFPLSAVAIARLTESKDQIFWPRLEALSLYYRQLAHQIIRQYVKKGISAEIGEEGKRRKFDPSKLKGDFTIWFKYFSQSPDQEIANYSVGLQAKAIGISEHYIFENILKLENPAGVIMQRKAEEAEELDPTLKLTRYIVSLINQDTKDSQAEAKILKPTLMIMLRQKMSPAPQLPPPQEKKRPVQPPDMLPLFGEGGGGRRQLGRDQLEASEEAIVEEQEREQMAERNRTRRAFEGE